MNTLDVPGVNLDDFFTGISLRRSALRQRTSTTSSPIQKSHGR